MITGRGSIAYACHIYPAHVGGSVPNWIDFTAQNAPVVMTEWGFENTGPTPVSGTASGYGAIYKAWANGKDNVGRIGWLFDYIYHSYWFDTNWTILGNGNATVSTLYFGASDGQCMEVTPNTGSYNTNGSAEAPVMEYDLSISTSGTYYVWVNRVVCRR